MFILSVLPEFLRVQRYSLFAKPPSFFLFFYKQDYAIVTIQVSRNYSGPYRNRLSERLAFSFM